ncbi:TPA: hypothetical protein U2M23_002162 [Providencia stuartii]|nr:Uncharacterised protein [Providencia stuartii]HEM8184985.1 hypothetical protein [Providencia stuartii]HEM8189360.1 hypothetical protein [Providencia stuartii]HEM8219515.1 hypothetical protein [Providencia stuartii]
MAYFTDAGNGVVADDGTLITYSDAVNALECGHYDEELLKGLHLAAAVMGKLADEPDTLTPEQRVSVWRWVVVACFIREQQEKNGTIKVPNGNGGFDLATIYSNGKSSLSIYPAPLRLALSENLERIMVETFGKALWADFTVRMYVDFLDISLECGPRLSAKGREGLCILHDDYIRALQSEGIFPAMPTMH